MGLEAGTLTQYLTYGLQAAGFEVICMEARQVKAALSAMRNKTDKHDARGIAQLLRSGWYSRVHVKSLESHQIRALLSSRKAVLNKCIDLENEIRGLFKVFGIKLTPRLGHGSFDRMVREAIETDDALAHALLPLLSECPAATEFPGEADQCRRAACHDVLDAFTRGSTHYIKLRQE